MAFPRREVGPGLMYLLSHLQKDPSFVSGNRRFSHCGGTRNHHQFMDATMTASRQLDNRVRGIATGTSFRRLVAETLSRQLGKVVESTCAPFLRGHFGPKHSTPK